MTDQQKTTRSEEHERTRRKEYVAPRVIDYGSTSKLSAAKPGPNGDGGNTARKTGCL